MVAFGVICCFLWLFQTIRPNQTGIKLLSSEFCWLKYKSHNVKMATYLLAYFGYQEWVKETANFTEKNNDGERESTTPNLNSCADIITSLRKVNKELLLTVIILLTIILSLVLLKRFVKILKQNREKGCVINKNTNFYCWYRVRSQLRKWVNIIIRFDWRTFWMDFSICVFCFAEYIRFGEIQMPNEIRRRTVALNNMWENNFDSVKSSLTIDLLS